MGTFVEPMEITFRDNEGDELNVYTVDRNVYLRVGVEIIELSPPEARELAERLKRLAATVIMNDPR